MSREQTGKRGWDWSFLLYQTDVWIDSHKNVRKISEMDSSYAENVYRFLLSPRRAEGILHVISASAFATQGPTEGTAASDAYERGLDHLLEARSNPVQWMKELPLVEALHARVWGPELEPVDGPTEDVRLVLLKIKVPSGADDFDLMYDLEQALGRIGYDIEITGIEE